MATQLEILKEEMALVRADYGPDARSKDLQAQIDSIERVAETRSKIVGERSEPSERFSGGVVTKAPPAK